MEHKVLSQLRVIEGMVQKRIPNWNQTLRLWEQECAWEGQHCMWQHHTNPAKEGYVKRVAGLLQASYRWPSSNSTVAQTSHLHQGKWSSGRKSEFSDIRSAWKCKQSPSAMQTKKQRIKDMTEPGDNKDSQTKNDVEVPGQPAEPIQFLRFKHAQPCEESAGKTARSPSCKHTLALSITPLLTLAFLTCTNMQENSRL